SLIRPFIYIEEYDIKAAVERLGLPILKNPCPANHNTTREYAKNLIKQLGADVPNAKQSILGAIYHPERMNLWDTPSTSDTSDTSCRFKDGDTSPKKDN
ncbi:MAG: hypothetical protein J5815_03340, partial [Clostridia bacterium]|nr:hypothetical protein [Clostridia bacterium]